MLLGFSLGGFLDGILLHQILQWHHLLSLVRGMQDLRLQVLWDGYFHAVMYGLAAAALLGIWRATRASAAGAGRKLLGALLLGFGLWHAVDAVLSHWILGIHRIRIDSPNPLAWDWLWLAAFGLVPMFAAVLLLRGRDDRRLPGSSLAVLLILTGGAAAWSLAPPRNQPFTTVVFRPGLPPAQVFAAIDAAQAQLVWTDADMSVAVVRVAPPHRWSFYRRGALLVGGAGTAAGCVGWSRA